MKESGSKPHIPVISITENFWSLSDSHICQTDYWDYQNFIASLSSFSPPKKKGIH